jgi:hypothetical protein
LIPIEAVILLTLLADPRARETVAVLCKLVHPRVVVTHATSVADAVLALGRHPLQLVLLDRALCQPMQPLLRVVRRGAPQATLWVFGDFADGEDDAIDRDRRHCASEPRVKPWTELVPSVNCWLKERQQQRGDTT